MCPGYSTNTIWPPARREEYLASERPESDLVHPQDNGCVKYELLTRLR